MAVSTHAGIGCVIRVQHLGARMAHAPIWKSRPIFITSTFQDMQAERSHLRDLVLPRLEEWLRQKRQHVEWIDLRVGVPSAEIADESEREISVLKVCFEGVKRSRPFLIALIGDRYGWIPPKERAERAVAEAGFTTAFENRSVTDLEIDFGAFFDSDQAKRCLFFFRKALPYEKMGTAAGKYSDAHAAEFDAAEKPLRKAKLEALIERIKKNFPGQWFDYEATWDGKAVSGLDGFGNQVEAEIKKVLEAEYAADPAPAADLSPEDLDRLELADFAEDRAHEFVGREILLADLEQHIASEPKEGAPWGLCITGEAGSGKSALFGALVQGLTHTEKAPLTERFKTTDVLVLAHAAGASPRAASVDAMLRRWIGELAAFLGESPNLPENPKPDDVDNAFASLLGRAALKQRVVVLLDALDQFEPTSRGRFVTWLPKLWHENARFIATAIPGDASEALAKRPAITLKPIPPLDKDDAELIVANISKHYGRTLEPKVVAALAGDDSERWRNPLWLTLATEEVNLVDADDFARAAEFKGSEAEKLRDMMTATARDLPPDVPGLYHHTFAHAAELFGAPTVQAFLGLIAVGRVGWRESDFRVLLPKLSGEAWDAFSFANLRHSFRGQLRRRGADQWEFTHAQMRPAVKAWLDECRNTEANDANGEAEVLSEEQLHTALGDHLLALPADDPLHVSETMLHLLEGTDGLLRAAKYYGEGALSEQEVDGATYTLADIFLNAQLYDTTVGAEKIAELLYVSLPDQISGVICSRIVVSLKERINSYSPLSPLVLLARATTDKLTQLFGSDESWQDCILPLMLCYEWIGDLLYKQGKLDQAAEALNRSSALADRIAQVCPGGTKLQSQIANSYGWQGDLQASLGNFHEALAAHRKAIAIDEQLARVEPGNNSWRINLACSYDRVGAILYDHGDYQDALDLYTRCITALKIAIQCDENNILIIQSLSSAHYRIGDLLLRQGHLSGADSAYRTSFHYADRLVQTDPANSLFQRMQAIAYDGIGDTLRTQGKFSEALEAYQKGIAIKDRQYRIDPSNVLWRSDLSLSHSHIGDALLGLRNLHEALKEHQLAFDLINSLALEDPLNTNRLRNLTCSYCSIGDILISLGDPHAALKAFRNSIDIDQRLLTIDETNAEWRRGLVVSHFKIARTLYDIGPAGSALDEARIARDFAQECLSQNPDDTQARNDYEYTSQLLHHCTIRAQRANREMDTNDYPQPKTDQREKNVESAARNALNDGKLAVALRILECEGGSGVECHNLMGVCYLRLMQPQRALECFHKLLFSNSGSVPTEDASVILIANHATAQLLTGDIRGAKATLDQVWDKDQPAVSRLFAAFDRWEQTLSLKERLKWRFDGVAPKPFHLDPPYGEI